MECVVKFKLKKMQIVLTTEDLAKLDELIQNTPFKFAAPFFQFFQGKLAEIQKNEREKKLLKVEQNEETTTI